MRTKHDTRSCPERPPGPDSDRVYPDVVNHILRMLLVLVALVAGSLRHEVHQAMRNLHTVAHQFYLDAQSSFQASGFRALEAEEAEACAFRGNWQQVGLREKITTTISPGQTVVIMVTELRVYDLLPNAEQFYGQRSPVDGRQIMPGSTEVTLQVINVVQPWLPPQIIRLHLTNGRGNSIVNVPIGYPNHNVDQSGGGFQLYLQLRSASPSANHPSVCVRLS